MTRIDSSDGAAVTRRGDAPDAPDWAEALPAGAALGRYLVASRLGAGGAGVVYAAYDPELDRKVALKVLRGGDAVGHSEGQARLLREAQAMARVNHPNVMPVYDVGTCRDRGFVAMELVDGGTAREWLVGRPSTRAILATYIAAGRGLAAAHSAGLVHRDFKPDNVLVGRDGRVRVTDFGLVRASSVEASPQDGPLVEPAATAVQLTRADRVMGTPAYMAPEQHLRQPTDARTDQFSFCVSLYEALCGRRPFLGVITDMIVEAKQRGEVLAPPAGAALPAWIGRVLRRGMSPDAADRFPSMEALLAELERDPAKRRAQLGAGAVALGALLAAIVAGRSWVLHHHSQLCRGAAQNLDGVWDSPMRARLAQALGAHATSVAQVLDRYTAGWVAMRTEACEATRVRGDQPESLLGLRMGCLDDRLKEVRALASLFAQADAKLASRAVEAASGLQSLSLCADGAALAAPVRPPQPRARAEVDRLRGRLAEATALGLAGRYRDGLTVATEAAGAAAALRYQPLEAEALFRQGSLMVRGGDPKQAAEVLERAVLVATESRHDLFVARAESELVWTSGYWLEHHADGHRWARLARASIARLGGDDELRAMLLVYEGCIYDVEGDGARSLALAEEALPIAVRVFGRDGLKTASFYNKLGASLLSAQRYADARAPLLESARIYERAVGPDYVLIASPLANLGTVAAEAGRFDEAIAYARRALAIELATRGPEHPETAQVLDQLGYALRRAGQHREAVAQFQRAATIYLGLSASHAAAIYPLSGAGESLLALGDKKGAVAALQRALEIGAAVSANPATLAEVRETLARVRGADTGH